MGTYATRPSDISRRWYLVDANGLPLGRMASEVAGILRGKWKPYTCPYLDVGDHVVIINAEKVKLTGRKLQQKKFWRHSGYLGSGHFVPMRQRMAIEPQQVVRDAIWGMLPHNPLGRQMVRKLKIYAGGEHPHAAQQPVPIALGLHGRGYPGQEEGGAPQYEHERREA